MFLREELLKRIEINPKVMVGKPVIKRTAVISTKGDCYEK